ncbi:lysine--tRNA ligase [Kaistia dalseonensis]|uniref:Lysine--tRNA ligase n=1 Tax=Kaistia dalseonensis TaxID=410840 RepID=A0ABU0HDR7_9HYPH|nr:lysine--tRNA ligase [Kaistia dalseonensis]MCX5497824.1 lysine--tRNA ligase [Kaistia dalseonensis]MDQ0440468.1 lysyl-tRNA synthetase class 1 [Kaistia dalseonensis]
MSTATPPILDLTPALVEAARVSKAWPFEEARRIIARLEKHGGAKQAGTEPVLFETGYGPSGLPHIGTFGEVARTTMVRTAFRLLTEDKIPTRLLSFSDDMDGLRKVPTNVPNQEMMKAHLGQPLTRVPDPFSNEYPSFGAANNARLRAFLDSFGFAYEFASATDYYTAGRFDAALRRMLEVYDEVMDIILPTLGAERRATYSPFLPISKKTGVVLQVPMVARDVEAGTITYIDPEDGERVTTEVTGGAVKCQWKADWAMRWFALGVDYEMSGKDLIDSVKLSTRICRALGTEPPECFTYEHFLDENGEKISKSKGNGLTIEQWLTYAAPESLSLLMYTKPKTAKRLSFDVIPKTVDDYFGFVDAYPRQPLDQQIGNPVWHIHTGHPPETSSPILFSMLLNLVSVSDATEKGVLWAYISRYMPHLSAATHAKLDELVGFAIRYFNDVLKAGKHYVVPEGAIRDALQALDAALAKLPAESTADEIQTIVFDIGRAYFPDPNKKGPDGNPPGVSLDWFRGLYQVLLGQDQGPRFGSFVAIYGIPETRERIAKALSGELAS